MSYRPSRCCRSKRHVVIAWVRDPMGLSMAVFAQAFHIPHIVVPWFTAMNIKRVMHVKDDFAFRASATAALVSAIFQHLPAEFKPARVLQFLQIGHSATVSNAHCQSMCRADVHLSPLPPLLKERGTSRCGPGSPGRTAPVSRGKGPVLAPPFAGQCCHSRNDARDCLDAPRHG